MEAHPPAAMSAARENLRERRGTCSICGSSARWQPNPHRPFCSLTCRLVDLGVWLDEGYRILPDERRDVP